MTIPDIRIGEGWDVHALVQGRKLVIGGVHVPFDRGLQGHSDADVLRIREACLHSLRCCFGRDHALHHAERGSRWARRVTHINVQSDRRRVVFGLDTVQYCFFDSQYLKSMEVKHGFATDALFFGACRGA